MSPLETTEQPEQLLEQVKATPIADLAASVQRTEAANVGATVEPVYGKRKVRFFMVTESELSQVGLANLLATICVGFGSALIGFGVDVFKDVLLGTNIPEQAELVANYVQRICLLLGGGFYFAAGAIFWWRRSLLEIIKSERA